MISRAKSINHKEWITGYYVELNGLSYIVNDKYNNGIRVFPLTVGRKVGRADRENVDIYEGDIIELVNEVENQIRVVCKYGTAERQIDGYLVDVVGFYYENSHRFKSFPILDNFNGGTDYDLFKIIGNTTDDLELL